MRLRILFALVLAPVLLFAGQTVCRWEFTSAKVVKELGNARNARAVVLPLGKGARAGLDFDAEQAPGSPNGSLKIAVHQSDGRMNSVPLCFQSTDLTLQRGGTYRIAFQIRADADCEIKVQPREGQAPWRTIGGSARDTFRLAAGQWQKIDLQFAADDEFSGRLRLPVIYLGQVPGGTTLWLSDLLLSGGTGAEGAVSASPAVTPAPPASGKLIGSWEFTGAKELRALMNPQNAKAVVLPLNNGAKAGLYYDAEQAPGSPNGTLKVAVTASVGKLASIPLCFQRTDLKLRKGITYRIDFQVRASVRCRITVQPKEGQAPWRTLGTMANDVFQLAPGEWQKITLRFAADDDFSGRLRLPVIYLGRLLEGTELWISDVRLFELPTAVPAKADSTASLWTPSAKIPKMSPPPQALRKWGYAEAWKREDGARTRISLCNCWQIAPVASAAEAPPAAADAWRNFIVPGHWKGGNISNFIRTDDGVAMEKWNGLAIASAVHHAWYRRTVDLPGSLRGKELFLRLERIDEGGEIRLNGRTVFKGAPDPVESVRVNITDAVRLEAENELLIRVDSPGSASASKGGLMGAVWLEVEPQRSMGEPEIRTLLSAGKMTVNFHGSRSITGGTLHFTLRDAANGSTVWQGSRPWAPEVELDYIAPKLWSPDNPNLYYMDIEWRDEAGRPADRCTRRFGFREFKIAGNQYLLNGRPVILRADTDYMKIVWATDWHLNAEHLRREFRLLKRFCINAVYTQDSQPSAIADIADEEGMLLLTTNVVPYRELEKLSEAELADMTTQYLETAKKERKFYNHPSRVAWIIDIWFNYHNGATNGEYIGLKYGVKSYPAFDADGRQVVKSKPDPNLTQPMRMARMKRLNDRAALFSKHFPDMPAFTGGSGEVNGVYSTHIYHTWGAPRMELRALFSRYAMQPDLPVFIGEHNIPYAGSYYQLAQPYSVANGGISLFMENFARDAGERAYLYPPVYTRRPLHGWGKESLQDGIHDKDPWNSYSIYSPMYLETLGRNISAMIPAWRAAGVNGYGMFGCIYNNFVQAGHQLPRFVPVSGDMSAPDFKPETLVGGKAPLGFEPFGDALDIRPTLAATPYLSAMADTICAFFDAGGDPLEDNHSFFSGADFAQDLIVMNDAGKAKEWRLVLSLASADGQRFWEHQEELRVGAGEHRKVPVRFTLPQVDLRSEWLLSATLVPPAGNGVLRATKAVQIFPRPVPPALNRRLYLYDPEGILTVALKKLGLNFTALPNLLDIPLDGAVVIGRRAFSLSSEVPDLCALAARGAQILVLEQEQNSSMELMKVRTREAFINAAAHPLLQGFKDADFASWSGSHAITAPYQSGTNGTQWADFGNRNMVAAYVFRRPQQGNYRSLLVSGFDLFQTPLLEYSDRGSWIASTLEITERVGWDPVPTHLLLRMIARLDRGVSNRRASLFFGGRQGDELLRKMKVDCRTVDALEARELAGAGCLIVADPDFRQLKQYRFEINDFVYNGGTVLYLQAGEEFYSTAFPFAMKLGSVTARQAVCREDAPDAIWRNGWGNGELYWHFPVETPAFTEVPPEAQKSDPAVLVRYCYGAGSFVFCSILPDQFRNQQIDADTPKIFAHVAQGKTVRLLSALFTSCGVTLRDGQNAYQPKSGVIDCVVDLAQYKWSFATDPENRGLQEKWHTGASGSGKWMQGLVGDGVEVGVGVPFEKFLQQPYDGWAWYTLKLDLPENLLNAGKIYFSAGAIDDFDEVYVNGTLIGKTGKETAHYWIAPRQYAFPSSLLKAKDNVIAVRVFDEKGNGGIVRLPLNLSNRPAGSGSRAWRSSWPDGMLRDYEYMSDLIRQY